VLTVGVCIPACLPACERSAYRLCKVIPGKNATESCFQKGHLDFIGDTQWLQTEEPAPHPSSGGVSGDPDHPTAGLCGHTAAFEGCGSAGASSGSFHAVANHITDLSECAIFILNQQACGPRAKYVSFSSANDDCSWYEACHVSSHSGYTSVAIRPLPPAPQPPLPSAGRNATRVAIPRVTVSEGTTPAGSQWARVPIPACRYPGSHLGANCHATDSASCCKYPNMSQSHQTPGSSRDQWWRYQDCVAAAAGNGVGRCDAGHLELQFPEPAPGASGLWSRWRWCGANPAGSSTAGELGDSPGTSCVDSHDLPMIATNIVDKVQVPETLEPGDYLLSWRWDVRCLLALFRCFFLFPLLIFFASRKYVQSVQCGG
jgi:hypothetical protein